MDWKKSKSNPFRIKIKGQFDEKSKDEIIEDYIDIYIKNEKLKKEKEKLERELKKYKNSNTPSSANKHLKTNTLGKKAKHGARRGAPKNHKGATIELGEPQRIVPLYAKECEHCQSKNIKFTNHVKKRKIITLKITKEIVEYDQYEICCLDCHNLTLPTHPDLPDQGIYDKKILAFVNYLKFKTRATHEGIQDIMQNIFAIPMTGPTTFNIIKRTSKKLEPQYIEIAEQLKQSSVVNGDETSHSINGINNWIWVFCNQFLTLFKFNKERGGTIIEETLGKNFKGTLVSDGWATYTVYCRDNKTRQGRCWSHGYREVKDVCKDKHPDLYKWYCDIYARVKKAKTYKYEKKRIEQYNYCKKLLELWIGSTKSRRDTRKLAIYIENGFEEWFTAILYPEVPLDNNEAERSIRPFVVIRKIIGCFRSEIGPHIYETMMSLISTWEKQGKNIIPMLENSC